MRESLGRALAPVFPLTKRRPNLRVYVTAINLRVCVTAITGIGRSPITLGHVHVTEVHAY